MSTLLMMQAALIAIAALALAILCVAKRDRDKRKLSKSLYEIQWAYQKSGALRDRKNQAIKYDIEPVEMPTSHHDSMIRDNWDRVEI